MPVKIETKKVKLSEIKLNPDNPRRISNSAMDKLVKSLHEFPEMMELREIVVDETMTILGGNMRFLVLQKIKAKECIAKIVTGLSPEQKREFIIKDNSTFGEWDMDALSNAWSDLPLIDWGIDIPEAWMSTTKEELSERTEEIKPYKMSHVLISFPPEKIMEIEKYLEKITKIEGIEYEISSN